MSAEEILAARKARVDEPAPDPDQGFNPGNVKSIGEAQVAEELEFRGVLRGLCRPPSQGEGDFIDEREPLDIKGVQDRWPNGRFTAEGALHHVSKQINRNSRNVILDTRMLSEPSINVLRKIVVDNSWTDRIVWYPPMEMK